MVQLKRVMNSMGAKMTDDEVDEMVRQADLDGDGLISLSEFAIMVKNFSF